MKNFKLITLFICLLMFTLAACEKKESAEPQQSKAVTGAVTSDEIQAIAKKAYVYGFPMVMNYKTMYQYAVDTESSDYKGPFNQVACEARLFTPEDRAVVTPNADTPYCMFWMDLRAEPLVLSVPEIEKDRYYSFQIIDFYTHNNSSLFMIMMINNNNCKSVQEKNCLSLPFQGTIG